MRRSASWCLAVSLAVLAGCSRQPTSNCEPVGRYSTASSAPAMQIPDDLSPPDEADALRLPPVVGASVAPNEGCLESPPPFSGAVRPGRAAETEVPAVDPPAQPVPADGDRVIEN